MLDIFSKGAFVPHHSIEIVYPAHHLCIEGEQQNYADPNYFSSRFEPRPLLSDEDEALAAYPHSDEPVDTRFISLTAVQLDNAPSSHANSLSTPTSQEDRLISDVTSAVSRLGSTKIEMVIFEDQDEEDRAVDGVDDNLYVLIRRETTFVNEIPELKYYQIEIEDFLHIDAAQQWYLDACDVVELNSDRAIRNFRARASRAVWRAAVRRPWKKRRTNDFKQGAMELVCAKLPEDEVRKLVDGKEECYACQEPFNDSTVYPTRLNACKHVACHECLRTWFKANGVKKANCPLCREKTFVGSVEGHVKLGEDKNGNYLWDDRFNDWENFERSCADLDLAIANSLESETTIIVDSTILMEAWDHLINFARTEPETSTPHHLNPAHYHELIIPRSAISLILGRLEGECHSRFNLQHWLMAAVLQGLDMVHKDAWMFAYAGVHLNKAEIDQYVDHLRPGLLSFTRRTIERMIQLLVGRKCGCEKLGLHEHGEGLRMYYNPKRISMDVLASRMGKMSLEEEHDWE